MTAIYVLSAAIYASLLLFVLLVDCLNSFFELLMGNCLLSQINIGLAQILLMALFEKVFSQSQHLLNVVILCVFL